MSVLLAMDVLVNMRSVLLVVTSGFMRDGMHDAYQLFRSEEGQVVVE